MSMTDPSDLAGNLARAVRDDAKALAAKAETGLFGLWNRNRSHIITAAIAAGIAALIVAVLLRKMHGG